MATARVKSKQPKKGPYEAQWSAIKKQLKQNFYATPDKANKKLVVARKETLQRMQTYSQNSNAVPAKEFKLDSTQPQILHETNSNREAKAYDVAFQDFLNSYNKINEKEITRVEIKECACALLVANQHHLYDVFARPETNPEALIQYFFKKIQYKLPVENEKIAAAVRQYIKHEFEVIRKGKQTLTSTRTAFNRTLPADMFSEQWLNETKLTPANSHIIKVNIDICDSKRNTHKNTKNMTLDKLPLPEKYTSLGKDEKNVVVIDKATNKILALQLKNQVAIKKVEKIKQKTPSEENKHFWGETMRDKSQGGAAVNFGVISKAGFPTKFTQMTTHAKGEKLMPHFKDLATDIGAVYQKYLPVTYKSANSVTNCYRQSGIPFLAANAPYTTITANRRAAFKPHRDCNAHHYSSMVVLSMDGKQPNTTTLFLEWKDQNQLPIGFVLGHGDLLIADTDYVHCVDPRTHTTDRISLVYYTYGGLKVSPQLACEDSDIEEMDYSEQKPIRLAKKEGESNKRKTEEVILKLEQDAPRKKMRVMSADTSTPITFMPTPMDDKKDDKVVPLNYSYPTLVLVDKEDSLTYGKRINGRSLFGRVGNSTEKKPEASPAVKMDTF